MREARYIIFEMILNRKNFAYYKIGDNSNVVCKKIVKKIIYGNRADSSSYVSFLRNAGCSIGDKTVIYDPPSTFIDVTRPWLINIGEGVKLQKG